MRRYDIVATLQDYRNVTWSERANSSGTAGTYLKARVGKGTRARYLKLSRYDGVRIDGTECINEIVASRLMDVLGIEHLTYRLIHARVVVDGMEHETWLNSSRNFRAAGEQKMGLGHYFELYRNPGEEPLAFCVRQGWGERIAQMMLVDYLIVNRDRHASNIEVLIDRTGAARLAPLFDNGLSFLAPYGENWERIAAFKPLQQVATTNFVGSRSLEENLRAQAPVDVARPLAKDDRETLFAGLDQATPTVLLDKMWDIIWNRWCWYAGL